MRHDVVRAGCFTIVAAILPFARARTQISPGPLSAAHVSLDGPLNCAKCHAGGKETMTSRCVSCHREITWLVERNRGLHARAGRADCSSCHPDHAGRDFALIKWPDGSAQRFDHARTGWALDGKHVRLACEKCHTETFRVSPAAALAPKRANPGGWVGLETNCASCHEDVHKASLGRTCESCHTTTAWSPAPKFDHERTPYPLTGKHTDVTCEKCHTTLAGRTSSGSPLIAQFKPLAHADCVSCHRDPHQGRLTGACANCHVTTSFASLEGRTFSHDRTRYPLRGLHAPVPCASCHAGYPSRIDRPAFATCAGCHGDPHAKKGAGMVGTSATDCASCHSVGGFKPSTFTLARHAQSTRCASCHTDAHGGQLATSPGGGECKSCHAPSGWKPSTFGVREHATLGFALTGRHAAISCASCHAQTRPGLSATSATRTLGSAQVAFKLGVTTCDGCHTDPHGGRYRATAASAQGTCASCHDTRAFRPSTIDVQAHSRFSFALEGAHRAAPCVACHTTMRSTSSYAIQGATCATCHGTPHGTQFAARPDSGACQSCHDVNGWTPASRFVHDANGGFVLGAAHAKVPCASCHRAGSNAALAKSAANAARVWHGVARNCEACHRSGAGQ